MKKDFKEEIEIPQGTEIVIKDELVNVKGPKGEVQKKMDNYNITVKNVDGKLFFESKNATKREKRMIYTIISHIKNMIKGVNEGFEYKLKICYSHFPITVEAKGQDITVKNFLGERVPRKTQIPKGAEIKVEKEFIIINSVDKELAGQAAANLERVTKVRMRDRRVFQDGIYLTHKAGRAI